MSARVSILLFILGLGVIGGVAFFQRSPGYMDADYYYAGGLRLAQGYGFSEPFLWNYLDDPDGLPHPSHLYWMPLASMLAAAGMKLFGDGFSAARLGFMLVAACIPPLTASLAYSFTGRRSAAILAGLLAVFSSFYLAYLPTTDTFGMYMLLGLAFLRIANRYHVVRMADEKGLIAQSLPLFMGVVVGAMHLTRADGLLWLILGGGALLWAHGIDHPRWLQSALTLENMRGKRRTLWLQLAGDGGLLVLGYLLVMGPWLFRNLIEVGSPLAPGGSRALWLQTYDELFAYPADHLSWQSWQQSGLGAILKARLWSAWQNLQTFLVVQGQIFLAPLVLLGVWRLRRDFRVKLGLLAWSGTFLTMSLVFPEQGWRGGFFHSGAALQPLFWAVVPSGLEAFLKWGQRVRGWHACQARVVFQAGLVGLAIFLTLMVAPGRVKGDEPEGAWDTGFRQYAGFGHALESLGAAPGDIIMVNNPPGFFAATNRSSIPVPFGDEESLLAAGRRYGAEFVILELNHSDGLSDLYANPRDLPGLDYLNSYENAHFFRFVD